MWRIPLSDLNYGPEEEQAVVAVLRSKWLTMGAATEQFEQAMAEHLGVRHAIAVANCTCALELAYKVLAERHGATAGGRVLMPSLTFVATANAAIQQGLAPEFCDIAAPDRPLLDVAEVEAVLDRTPCVGVAIVHYAGFDADAENIAELCRQRGLFLVEDAAHAVGSRTATGRMLGTLGDIACFSFFSNKNLATGEGGLLATNDDELATKLRLLRSHGMTSLTHERHTTRTHGYDVLMPGHNYRCTEITAALGLEQLKKLEAGNGRRRDLYRHYVTALAGTDQVHVGFAESSEAIDASACHILPLLCATVGLRNNLRGALTAAGIQSSHHYPPIHQFTWFRGAYPELHLPNTENLADRELTLPLHPNLIEAEVDEVCGILLQTLRSTQ